MPNGTRSLWIIWGITLTLLSFLLLFFIIRPPAKEEDKALSLDEEILLPFQRDVGRGSGEDPEKKELALEVETPIPVWPVHRDPSSPPPPLSSKRIAILIDDLGGDLQIARRLLRIDAPLTLAILPGLRYSHLIAEEARLAQRDVLLHLPMEPHGYPQRDPGYGALFSTMSTEEIATVVRKNLTLLPQVVGVNNHMGSKLTENSGAMEAVLQVVKEHHLFFVDSKTTPHSVAYQTAKRLGIKSAYRHVFLDNEQQGEAIHQQILKLAEIARRNGGAIGIGHPYPITVQSLEATLPQLKNDGFTIVPVSQLLK